MSTVSERMRARSNAAKTTTTLGTRKLYRPKGIGGGLGYGVKGGLKATIQGAFQKRVTVKSK